MTPPRKPKAKTRKATKPKVQQFFASYRCSGYYGHIFLEKYEGETPTMFVERMRALAARESGGRDTSKVIFTAFNPLP